MIDAEFLLSILHVFVNDVCDKIGANKLLTNEFEALEAVTFHNHLTDKCRRCVLFVGDVAFEFLFWHGVFLVREFFKYCCNCFYNYSGK